MQTKLTYGTGHLLRLSGAPAVGEETANLPLPTEENALV